MVYFVFMTTEIVAEPREAIVLPDDFPAVSVSLRFGELLRASKSSVEVDFAQLNQVMLDRGIPPEEFGRVEVVVDEGYKLERRGEAWTDKDKETYNAVIYPSFLQRFGLCKGKLQRTVVHEFQHLSDYIDRDYMHEDKESTERRHRVKRLRQRIGSLAMTTASVLTVPEVAKTTYEVVDNNPSLQNGIGVLAVMAIPAYWLTLAYPVSRMLLYRTQDLERRAFKAARETHRDYDEVISIRRAKTSQ